MTTLRAVLINNGLGSRSGSVSRMARETEQEFGALDVDGVGGPFDLFGEDWDRDWRWVL